MILEHQAHFQRVQSNFTFILCGITFLLIMAQSPARGDAPAGQPLALETQASVQLSVSSTATRSGNTTTYQLTAGWNLISINLKLDEASQALLRDKGAMALDENSKAHIVNGNLAVFQACWIYCQTAETLTLSGAPPENFDFVAGLQPGWNFAGPLTESLLSGDGIFVWGWNGQYFYRTDSLLAGHGYWIYLSDAYVRPPAEDTYLVIDLSEGPGARSYPVTCLSIPPAEGWTEEYKTTKLVLRKIPAGTFMMGSPTDELGREDDETQHQVTLTKDFYVGVFEVTQKQWNLVMGDWPSWFENESCRDSRPVEQVSYEDIRGSTTGLGWPINNNVDAGSFL
ncbi:MAG: formylglycine-generating enzyme family protein, partial [Lentisphaeria bacterium]